MDKDLAEKVLEISNQIEDLSKVNAFLEEMGDEWGLPVPLVLSMTLVMEEALTNIMLYAFDDNNKHIIKIFFKKSDDGFSITIVDDGKEYDPTSKPDPDITLPAEQREIGGLGIFLIKKIMDQVRYQRNNDRNYLILNKKMKALKGEL